MSFYDTNPRRTSEGIDQLPIRDADKYSFNGPMIANVVYVTHPVDAQRLVQFADFDETLARDRLDEALRVFTDLGASRIVATANRVDVTRASAAFGRRRSSVSINAGRGSSWQLAVDQLGNGGAARDPRPLRYADITGLESACDVVMRNGGTLFKIEIESKSQFGVDGELAGKLRKSGFTVSLSADRTQYNQFRVHAAFGEDAAPRLDEVVKAVSPESATDTTRFDLFRRRRNAQP